MNYEVVVSNGNHTGVYPVEEFRLARDHLVPVYDGGMTPKDEPPMATVTLREKKTVAALLLTSEAIVIGKRSSGSTHSPGLWEMPGGKPEPGETEEQALARELREELDIDAIIGDKMGVFPVSNGYVAHVYVAHTFDVPKPDPLVHGLPALPGA